MFLASLIGLAVAVVAATLALFSGHIPFLARLTGAAPLLPDDQPGRDFAASRAAGYVESADDWAARTEAKLAATEPPAVTP